MSESKERALGKRFDLIYLGVYDKKYKCCSLNSHVSDCIAGTQVGTLIKSSFCCLDNSNTIFSVYYVVVLINFILCLY